MTTQALANPQADLLQRLRAIAIADVEGTPPESKTLQALLFDIGWERRRYDRYRSKLAARYESIARAKQRAAAAAELAVIDDRIAAVRKQCEQRAAELRAELDQVWQPHVDIIAANKSETDRLKHLARPTYDEGRENLADTADPALEWRILELGRQTLGLYDQVGLLDSEVRRLETETESAVRLDTDMKPFPSTTPRSKTSNAERIASCWRKRAELLAQRDAIGEEIQQLRELQQDWRSVAIDDQPAYMTS